MMCQTTLKYRYPKTNAVSSDGLKCDHGLNRKPLSAQGL